MITTTLKLPPELAARLKATGNTSEAIREELGRYQALLSLARADLREILLPEEVALLADICKGAIFEPYEVALLCLVGEAEQAEEACYSKWGVSRPALLEKLHCLSPLHSAALIEAIERFWRAAATGMSVDAAKLLQG